MSFTGIVASVMWDRPSSWKALLLCQASYTVHIYIYIYSVLAVTWAVSSKRSDTGCIASALEQGGDRRTFIRRFGWPMQEDNILDVWKRAKYEAERKRGSSSKHPLSTTHREDNCTVSCSSGVSCGGLGRLRSSSLPRAALCHDCKNKDGALFQKAA